MLSDPKSELARRNLIDFVTLTKPDYSAKWFHEYTCRKIQDWATGKGANRLMIFMPPQHGKSELSTRRLPAWILGKMPDTKIAIAAYNHTIASRFNRAVQKIIDDPVYHNIFPETYLNKSNMRIVSEAYLRNNDEFEIVGKKGSLVSVGVGGGLTSRQVDMMILDDVYKDHKEAWSPVTRSNVSEWYSTVVETRLHNDSKVLIVFTRWHEEDLGGELLAQQPEKWEVVKIPAIKTDNSFKDDPRDIGDALWPEKHGIEKLRDVEKRNSVTFENLYQQDPKPAKGRMYQYFREYDKLPEKSGDYIVKAYVDTADTGKDYLCSIVYVQKANQAWILDVIYTQEPNEVTEVEVSKQMTTFAVNVAYIESNNGGRAFARNVDRITKQNGNHTTQFNWFHQGENKEQRIFSNAANVQNQIFFPEGWSYKFPQYYEAMTRHMNKGGNKHDDAPDATTGIIEKMGEQNGFFIF